MKLIKFRFFNRTTTEKYPVILSSKVSGNITRKVSKIEVCIEGRLTIANLPPSTVNMKQGDIINN